MSEIILQTKDLTGEFAGFVAVNGGIVFKVRDITSLAPADVNWTMSGEVVLVTLVGGLGTMFGPVAGAFVIIGMQNNLNIFEQWVTVIQGAIFVACVLLFRRGVVGELANVVRIRL